VGARICASGGAADLLQRSQSRAQRLLIVHPGRRRGMQPAERCRGRHGGRCSSSGHSGPAPLHGDTEPLYQLDRSKSVEIGREDTLCSLAQWRRRGRLRLWRDLGFSLRQESGGRPRFRQMNQFKRGEIDRRRKWLHRIFKAGRGRFFLDGHRRSDDFRLVCFAQFVKRGNRVMTRRISVCPAPLRNRLIVDGPVPGGDPAGGEADGSPHHRQHQRYQGAGGRAQRRCGSGNRALNSGPMHQRFKQLRPNSQGAQAKERGEPQGDDGREQRMAANRPEYPCRRCECAALPCQFRDPVSPHWVLATPPSLTAVGKRPDNA
jgi:hypothetical protein